MDWNGRIIAIAVAVGIVIVSLGVSVLLLAAASRLWIDTLTPADGNLVDWVQAIGVIGSVAVALVFGLARSQREREYEAKQQVEVSRVHLNEITRAVGLLRQMLGAVDDFSSRMAELKQNTEPRQGEALVLPHDEVEAAIADLEEKFADFPSLADDPTFTEIHTLHLLARRHLRHFKNEMRQAAQAGLEGTSWVVAEAATEGFRKQLELAIGRGSFLSGGVQRRLDGWLKRLKKHR